MADVDLDKHFDLKSLGIEDADDSIEVGVPDFHFDWSKIEGKVKNIADDQPLTSLQRNASPDVAVALMATPPPASASAHSSTSSNHILTLTDASTVSASSLVPTPPEPASINHYGRAGGAVSHEKSSSRTYGGRTFQRVVSAPMASRPLPEQGNELEQDSSTGRHTATLRPQLTHTHSASSVSVEDTEIGGPSRNTHVTPGLTDRTLGRSLMSSTRRIAGLSRFGGPARRVIKESEVLEGEGEEMPIPILDGSASLQHSSSSPPLSQRGSEAGPSRHRIAAVHPSERHDPSESSTPDMSRTTKLAGRAADLRPFEPSERYLSTPQPHLVENRPVPVPPNIGHHMPTSGSLPLSQSVGTVRRVVGEIDASKPVTHVSDGSARPAVLDARSTAQTAPYPPVTSSYPQHANASDSSQTGKRVFTVNGTQYERVGMLGKGGSSKVYSVLCHQRRTVFALKRVALDGADVETYRSYANEIELLKRLRGHDRIIQLIDHQITFSASNRPKVLIMVMECGEIDFAMLLEEQRGKPLNMNFVGLYWQQMLQAVHAVHQENVVHTDLKPANFVLVKGRLKIIDFGIAKAVANDTVNIQRDQQIGTVNYMSPEAINKMTNLNVLKLSYPSDVWSLGCILYQMVYGNPPFAHIPGGPLSRMNHIADPGHRIEYPDLAVPKVSGGLDPLTMAVKVMPSAINSMKACMAYDKEHRSTIPQLLNHEFLRPRLDSQSLPHGTTTITREQMAMLINYVLTNENGSSPSSTNSIAEYLFSQLEDQNTMSS